MSRESILQQPVQKKTSAALAAALYATFGASAAHSAPVIVDIADVTLGTYALDIDNDGTDEFFFARVGGLFDHETNVDTFGNAVVGYSCPGDLRCAGTAKPDGPYAASLSGNTTIDASQAFISGSPTILSGKKVLPYGEFFDPGTHYLGLSFDLGAGTQYGWAEIVSRIDAVPVREGGNDELVLDQTLTITRYGYDDVVGAPITTPAAPVPEPATLALLIAGAAGVLAMRRRQRQA